MAFRALSLLAFLGVLVSGQSTTKSSCPTLSASYAAPSVAAGWEARLMVQDVGSVRGIIFDSEGHLLTVSRGKGVLYMELHDGGGTCVNVTSSKLIIQAGNLNHGIAFSADGKTLYASTSDKVYSWGYDPSKGTVTATNQTIIENMDNADHNTRTLMMSSKQPGTLVVSRGSSANVDDGSSELSSGRSQIRAFNVANITSSSEPYDYSTTGRRLGWGLRNSVGIAEEPLTGGIYSVENSADNVERFGKDVHQDNPGEEMNFHGYLNASTVHQGGNYGYPTCFAVWGLDLIQAAGNSDGLTVGSQFVFSPNSTLNDTTCANERVAPRLTFQAHMAPLDLLFEPDGSAAYVSFHGSWDRDDPVGYKVAHIAFANGEPVEKSDSKTATQDIFANPDNSVCPDKCFRPVSLARDSKGRIFMTSDATNDIWVLMKSASSGGGSSTTPSATGASPSPTKKNGAVGGNAAMLGTSAYLGLLALVLSAII